MTTPTPGQRRAIWASHPDLLDRALSITCDLNEAHELVNGAMLRAWRGPGPADDDTRAWLADLLLEAAAHRQPERSC